MAAYTSVQLWSAVFTQGYVLWLEEPDASLDAQTEVALTLTSTSSTTFNVRFITVSCNACKAGLSKTRIFSLYFGLIKSFHFDTNMRTNSTKHRWLRLQQSCTGMIYPAVHGTQKDAPFKAGLILRTGYPLVVIRYRGKHFTGQERGRFFKSVTASWKNMRLLQIYQRILKIKTSLAVAWSQNEIPKQRTTGGPVIVFKDTIKVNIYWENQRPQANGGHDR